MCKVEQEMCVCVENILKDRVLVFCYASMKNGDTMMKIYETDRLHLREIDESYAEKVLQYYDKNREFLKAWEEYRPESFTLDYQKKKLQKDRKEFAEGKIIRLWIFKKGDDTEKLLDVFHLI